LAVIDQSSMKEVVMWTQGRVGFFAMLAGTALLSWALAAPAMSEANMGGGGSYSHHRGGKDFVGHVLKGLLRDQEKLNLTDEQVGKLKTIATEYAKTRIRGKAEVKLAEVDVRSLIFDDKADMGAIESAIRKSESAKTALRLEKVKTMRAAKAVLTPEQIEKWRAAMKERHRHGHHGDDQGKQS
jgi:Spy/CpxP family protein refolding chaperone